MTEKQPPILHLNQVSLTDGSGINQLLQEISLKVTPGERVAILGASGAGKTSLLRLLNRLVEPAAGSIAFASQPFKQIDVRRLRQQVVLVPQEPKLLGMAVRETLAYPLQLQQLEKGEIQRRLQTWLSRLHLPQDWLERREWELSLGQRQLISIARAFLMEPPVLLLDEPTSALDAGSSSHLIEILVQLAEEAQTTILMVNHQLDLARQFAGRVLYLEQGKLLEDAAAAQFDWVKVRENLLQVERHRRLNSQFE